MRRAMLVASGLVVALAVIYPVLDALDVAPGVVTSDLSVREEAPPPAVTPQVVPPPALDGEAPAPVPAKLATELREELASPGLGAAPGAMVVDATTGTPVLTVRVDVARTPASTAKLLTAAAVAAHTDLGATRRTRVVAGADDTLVLVADGDTLLARGRGNPYATDGRAGLIDLAEQTAEGLRGRTPPEDGYRLVLDDAVAAGPATAPEWTPADLSRGYTAPVAMLGLADDRALPGSPATTDPAMTAATAYLDALRQAGVSVTGAPTRGRGAATAGAAELATVESAPVGDMLALALADSDNALTESVARRAFAEVGVPTDFASAGAHVGTVLTELGVDTQGLRLVDASGLSRSSRASVRTITEVVQLSASNTRGGFTRVAAGLPVAGLTGTLHDRFEAPGTEGARGIARAKTGTLTGVGGLAGTVVDANGRLLVYTILADAAPPDAALETRAALDRFVTGLTHCRCS